MPTFLWWLLSLVVAGIVVGGVVVARQVREASKPRPKTEAELEEERLLQIDRAGQRALAANQLETARTLFIDAKRPGKAAQVAVREGKLELAGDLFEQAKLFEKALVSYRRAGAAQKLAALQERIGPKKPEAPASGAPQAAPQQGAATPPAVSFADAASAPVPLFAPANTNDGDANAADQLIALPTDTAASDAWLLEDELLELPVAAPAPLPEEPRQSTAQRAALGVIALVKSKKARGIVEETAAVPRRKNDDR